ncbi:MAG: alpha/beta hydrolase [Muribaculaceae bacterium]|nr:alpha/beta hydrolase [Muribaculaceae bacterium]
MQAPSWTPDILGNGFEACYRPHPDDYSGAVRSTIVRLRASAPGPMAILYVHGYSDYFFQTELAQMFAEHGYNFYAVDLRKYGRSYMEGQKMFQVRDLHEYFADIDDAIDVMAADGITKIILMGHSTGGLTTALYLSEDHSPLIRGLILNSPFLDWNLPPLVKKIVVPIASALGRYLPNVRVHQKPDTGYAHSLLARYEGEWDYRTEWKPDILPDPDLGWIRAIRRAQQQLRRGHIHEPVLLMHSTESVRRGDEASKYHRADAILEVESISRHGRVLSHRVTEVPLAGGLHDLALSRPEVRQAMYTAILTWLREI